MPSELPKLEKTASAMTKQQIPEIQIPEKIKEGIRHLKQLISVSEVKLSIQENKSCFFYT